MVDTAQVLSALAQVEDPELGRDIVSLGMVKDLRIREGEVSFTLALTTAACPLREQLLQRARRAVENLPGVSSVKVDVRSMTQAERQALSESLRRERPRPQNKIEHILAVMSGKGGVGKSTVTALLAVALQRSGASVGILDADITGPSIPKMFFPVPPRPQVGENGLVPPAAATGVRVMSINLLLPSEDQAVIWRGPLISAAIRQFYEEVAWGTLDYLLVDLPPGTSDASLTVMQSLPVEGVVMVTSPQALAGMVVRKAAAMAQQLSVPVLGIIENMAYLRCPHCGQEVQLFGPSHAAQLAAALNTKILGRLPLEAELSRCADEGRIAACLPEGFLPIALAIQQALLERRAS